MAAATVYWGLLMMPKWSRSPTWNHLNTNSIAATHWCPCICWIKNSHPNTHASPILRCPDGRLFGRGFSQVATAQETGSHHGIAMSWHHEVFEYVHMRWNASRNIVNGNMMIVRPKTNISVKIHMVQNIIISTNTMGMWWEFKDQNHGPKRDTTRYDTTRLASSLARPCLWRSARIGCSRCSTAARCRRCCKWPHTYSSQGSALTQWVPL